MLGRQARFTNPHTGEMERIGAYLHDVSEYVGAGLGARLRLMRLEEWRDAEAERSAPPRLLALEFAKP